MTMNGPWQEVTIAISGTTSAEIDLDPASKKEFKAVQVYNPALDSATITVKPSRKTGDTAVQAYTMDGDATGDYVNTTTARTGAGMNIFNNIYARFVTIILGASQTSQARTLYIRGLD